MLNTLKDNGIAFELKDYLEMADGTKRMVRDDKRGFIKTHTPGILKKLKLNEHTRMETLRKIKHINFLHSKHCQLCLA